MFVKFLEKETLEIIVLQSLIKNIENYFNQYTLESIRIIYLINYLVKEKQQNKSLEREDFRFTCWNTVIYCHNKPDTKQINKCR